MYNFDKRIERINTRCEKWDGLQEVFGDPRLLPLWVADMDFPCPPSVAEALKKRAEHPIYGYTIWDEDYYKAAKNWISRRHGWVVENEWILSSAGVVNGLSMAIRALTEKGEGVVINTPVYGPFFSAVEKNERKLLISPLKKTEKGYEIDFTDLEGKFKEAKAYILCSPHNPVGRVWSREELETIGILADKYDVTIISDEIHSDLILKGYKHLPIASLNDKLKMRTITLMAPSKTFNIAGLSTSILIIPDPKKRKEVQGEIERCGLYMGNTFGIEGLIAAYNGGEEWLEELLVYLEGNFDFVLAYFKENMREIKTYKPEATYLMWLDFSCVFKEQRELISFMKMKAGLALSGGSFFGPGGELFLRMNLACPRSIIEEALEKLKEAYEG